MIVTLGFHEHIVYSRLFRESVYQSYGVQVLGCWNFRHTDCPICLQQDRFVELPEEFYDGCIKLSLLSQTPEILMAPHFNFLILASGMTAVFSGGSV